MNIRQLKNFVIRPTLEYLGQGNPRIASVSAIEQLLGTVAHESQFTYLDQVTGPADSELGPAIGIYQIEPATMGDLFKNYLSAPSRRDLSDRVMSLLAARPVPRDQLATNLAFATAIARLIYLRSPVALAPAGDIAGHARVWKTVYNTAKGAGTESQFISDYQRLVAPNL